MAAREEDMSFLDHLEELRWHLVRSLGAILVFAIAAFMAKSFVWHSVILAPSRIDFWTYEMLCVMAEKLNTPVLCIEQLPFTIQSRQMTGQFTMHITSSMVIGIILAFPYAFWELWKFISPGLYDKEKNAARGATFFVSILFIAGISFGYYIITPLSVNFLSNYQVDPSVLNEFDITSYVSTLSMIVLASGMMFQLPVVVYFFTQAGFVTPQLMRSFRRHSIVVIFVLAAIITPPDVFSQILISIPLLVLYEISIYISAGVLKRKKREEMKGQV
ncbi:twin-arginine translocase subunit TatC [Peijinzhouia sedimentorum]